MIVQMIPAAPIEPPMAMRMMIVLRCSLVTVPDVGGAVDAATGAELVMVTGLTLDKLWSPGAGVLD